MSNSDNHKEESQTVLFRIILRQFHFLLPISILVRQWLWSRPRASLIFFLFLMLNILNRNRRITGVLSLEFPNSRTTHFTTLFSRCSRFIMSSMLITDTFPKHLPPVGNDLVCNRGYECQYFFHFSCHCPFLFFSSLFLSLSTKAQSTHSRRFSNTYSFHEWNSAVSSIRYRTTVLHLSMSTNDYLCIEPPSTSVLSRKCLIFGHKSHKLSINQSIRSAFFSRAGKWRMSMPWRTTALRTSIFPLSLLLYY